MLKLIIFFMLASFVVLSIQIQNINLRFMRLIIKRNAQKQMSRSSFVCKLHDLNYFELGLFFHIPWLHYTLEVIINFFYFLFYVENHQFNVNLSYLKKNSFSMPPLAYPLARSCQTCRFNFTFFCQHKLLGFEDQCVLKNIIIFPQILNLVYFFHLNMCKDHSCWHNFACTYHVICRILFKTIWW